MDWQGGRLRCQPYRCWPPPPTNLSEAIDLTTNQETYSDFTRGINKQVEDTGEGFVALGAYLCIVNSGVHLWVELDPLQRLFSQLEGRTFRSSLAQDKEGRGASRRARAGACALKLALVAPKRREDEPEVVRRNRFELMRRCPMQSI